MNIFPLSGPLLLFSSEQYVVDELPNSSPFLLALEHRVNNCFRLQRPGDPVLQITPPPVLPITIKYCMFHVVSGVPAVDTCRVFPPFELVQILTEASVSGEHLHQVEVDVAV